MASCVYQQRNEYAKHDLSTRGNIIELPRDGAHIHTTGVTHEGGSGEKAKMKGLCWDEEPTVHRAELEAEERDCQALEPA